MQAQNNAALVEELNTLLERLRIPPEVCIDFFLKLYFSLWDCVLGKDLIRINKIHFLCSVCLFVY